MQKTSNWFLTLIIVALTGLVSATNEARATAADNAAGATYKDKPASENKAVKKIDKSFYNISPYDIVYGNEKAPIEVLEYFSLTCPHCSYFYLYIFPELKKKYIDTGRVKWIKRLHVGDRVALEGSLLLGCVNGNMRKNYLNILLSKQSNWAFQKNPNEILQNIAGLGGMSKAKFQDCMDNKKVEHEIKALTIKALEVAEISGTPTFYINSKKLEIFSDQAFKDKFDEILSTKSK